MRLTVGIDRDLASFQAARGLDGHATFVHATVLLRKFLDDQTLFRDRKPNVGVFCFFFLCRKISIFFPKLYGSARGQYQYEVARERQPRRKQKASGKRREGKKKEREKEKGKGKVR